MINQLRSGGLTVLRYYDRSAAVGLCQELEIEYGLGPSSSIADPVAQ